MTPKTLFLIASLGLSILIGLVLGSGKREGGTDAHAQVLIGLSLDTLKEERWTRDRDRFVARCEELGARVLVLAANSIDGLQISNNKSLLASHVDCLVIVPHDGDAMASSVKEAKLMGVPVIAYDRMINHCDLDLYASFDNVEVGRQQARFLVDKLGGKGAIVRIYGAVTDNNAKLFKLGQDEVLKPYIEKGAITVLLEDWATDWKPEAAKKIAQDAIAKGGHFDAILASNDGTAGGAIQALIEARLAGVIVTGQDAELAACRRIANGTQTMTIYKPLGQLASGCAELAVKLAKHEPIIVNGAVDNGQKLVPSQLFAVKTVTSANLTDVVVDGFHGYDEIYEGVPEDRRPPKPGK